MYIRKHKFEVKTLSEVMDFIKLVDLDPIHQRLPVGNKKEVEKKYIAIIQQILAGFDFGTIIINENTDFVSGGPRYQFEIVDGSHRFRALDQYFGNKLTVDSKKFKDLSLGEKNRIMQRSVCFSVYENLNNHEIATLFKNINATTAINHQETVNATGNIPVANFIRNTTRWVKEFRNKVHELFEYSFNSKKIKVYAYLAFDNNRLSHDRIVARLYCIALNGSGPTACDDVQLEEMYARPWTIEELEKAKKKVDECLNFILLYAKEAISKKKTNRLSMDEVILLFRYFFSCRKRDANFNSKFIADIEKFRDAFLMSYYENLRGNDLGKKTYLTKKSHVTRGELFKKSLRKHGQVEEWIRSVEWLEESEYMNYDKLVENKIIVPRSSRSGLDDLAKKVIPVKQGHRDPITNEKLKSITYAHDTPHCRGGETDENNIFATNRQTNVDMGSLTREEYEMIMNHRNGFGVAA